MHLSLSLFNGRFRLFELCISSISPFCLIKSDRFKNLQDRLAEPVKQPGQWYGKYNAASREIGTALKQRLQCGVKSTQDGDVERPKVNERAKQPFNRPPAWKEYKDSFSV